VTRGRASALGALDVGDGVAHGLEVLDLVIGDGDAELLLGGDDDLSSWTWSVSTPATSLTMSARSTRISSVVAMS
jgi:hypothetical protein